ncbi:hypothetical protein MTO96_031084 [Rhipicephalus appendiculatus]
MARLQQTVPTPSVPKASAAAGAVQVNATRSTTSMRPANASEYEHDSMDCQDADTPVRSGQRDPRTPMKGHARNPAGYEDGWQTVLTLRQKKALAQGKKLKANVVEKEGNASQPQLSKATPTARRKPFSRKIPQLPKEDFKVVIRPHQGLPLKNFTSPQLAEAVITACRGQVSGDKFLLRIKPGSNIFIVSTPDQATADHIRCITELRVHGRTHAVNAYMTTGEGSGKGVIHGLIPHTPAETLRANLRIRTQEVEILRARKLGDTKTAVIIFYGPIIPRYVYYMRAKQSPPRPRWLSSDGSDDLEDEDEEWPSLHPEKVKKKPRGRSPSRSTMGTKKPKATSRSQSRSRSRRRDADVGTPNAKHHSLQLNHKSRAPGNTAENIDHTKIAATLHQQNLLFLMQQKVPRTHQLSWQKAAGLLQSCMSFVKSNRTETSDLATWMVSLDLDLNDDRRLSRIEPFDMIVRCSLDLGVPAILSLELQENEFFLEKRVMMLDFSQKEKEWLGERLRRADSLNTQGIRQVTRMVWCPTPPRH